MQISTLHSDRAVHFGFFFALVQLGLATMFAANPEPVVAAPKTHVLFMGADVFLEKGKEYYRVQDATTGALIIKPDGKPVNVPMSQVANMRINESLKISAVSIQIDDLKTERTYTLATDPFRETVKAVNLANFQSFEADKAQGAALTASMGVMAAGGALQQARGTLGEGDAAASMAVALANQASAQASANQAYNAPASGLTDINTQSSAAGTEASREMYDAIRLSFDVTSDKDLKQPYYAVIAELRDPASNPGQVRKWAYMKSLGPLSAGTTKHVKIFQAGMTPGYLIESCEVHVYEQGEELSTNSSRKRVLLTEEEALEYRIIDYISANKGRSLPASLAATTIPGKAHEPISPDQLAAKYYARVDKTGRVLAVFKDAEAKQPLPDEALAAELKTLRFNPALEKGKPVESIVAIKLGQLGSR